MSNKNRKEICGVDPNTWGDFDQALDGAQKVAKYFLPVLGASLIAGRSAEMLGATVRTEQAPEVSPLPADFTATPTEVATEMPTITSEPTATATKTQVPTNEIKFTEFSRKYFPSNKESYVAKIEGMQIPIGWDCRLR